MCRVYHLNRHICLKGETFNSGFNGLSNKVLTLSRREKTHPSLRRIYAYGMELQSEDQGGGSASPPGNP